MSKKTSYILISVFLGIILIGLLIFYFLYKSPNTSDNGTSGGPRGFIPIGGDGGSGGNGTDGETPIDNGVIDGGGGGGVVKRLRKITSEQVSGAGLLDVKAGTVVRYIEKATGHIYEVELFSEREGRISNTTMPKVYDAIWGNKNNSLMARYLKDDDETIETYSLTIKDTSTSTDNTVSGIAFPLNISDVSVFETSVFYLEQGDGYSSGIISNWNGGGKKQIWNSPIKELLSQYVNSSTVALTTKPDENSHGYLYFVNTSNGSYRKILGDIFGLSTLVNDNATKLLYLDQERESDIYLYDVTLKVKKSITPATFPEKCLFSKKNRDIVFCSVPRDYLQKGSLIEWYKGLISTTDDIWKYDTKNVTSDVFSNLQDESGEMIDVIKPILSISEQYVVFINKRDNSLWALDITLPSPTAQQ